ncbi:N-acetylmuramoyl-L-alanine amidase family protein [Candidatus Nitronereus thalassa]|uniref:N-acetylmuramoyl-L-alanine amidase n=1 Tax=Candidatus Nitronereus thalassa TaxID=3020898 RepID=A0ABU3K4D4_9BACT|nr:N-acetylmuramoyl-L-alanine amidase [Candidatus Nitronereus thalassa]MDT7041252.1 N-acetylmuramoyl-L-alanine amidase [Candidatus Nitronereus thalassa]
MIHRILISLIIPIGFLLLLPPGVVQHSAHSAISNTSSEHPAPIVVARGTQKSSRKSSPLTVTNVRYHAHKKYTRVVLDLPARAILQESKNDKNQTATIILAKSQLSSRALKKIRHRKFPHAISIFEGSTQTVILTLDLTSLSKYELQTLRKPNRVVVDLYYSKKTPLVTSKRPTPAPKTGSVKAPQKSPAKETPKPSKEPPKTAMSPLEPEASISQNPNPKEADQGTAGPTSPSGNLVKNFKDLVVVIDPGHGGKDPGATGKKGTQEKHITLKIGSYLKELIQSRLGAHVLMTREKDIFLDLEKRVEFANKKKADLFISIHVNSHPQRSIKGLEIYHFGKASDPRALEVAARENGMKLEDDAPPWQFIIADKLNDQKIEQSQTFAWTTNKTLVKALTASYKVKDHGVKTAPFYVLRFTTMPSILAEVAFVSNPDDENRLRSKAFQKQLAEGMYQAIYSYLKTSFPTLS